MAKNNNDIGAEAKRLNTLFKKATAARGTDYTCKKTCEELYYNDVESTKSEFTENQKDQITNSYNIPLSTKMIFPIVEQLLSFLTSVKPFPRLIAAEESMQDTVLAYEKAYHATWYESQGGKALTNALRDMLNVGIGFLRVRKNDFFNETTFNTLVEYVPWKNIVIDPECMKDDLSDAEYMVHWEVLRKEKAEKKYDIEIPADEDINQLTSYGYNIEFPATYQWDEEFSKQRKYTLMKEFFLSEEINVYLSENGDVGIKKPVPITIPNTEKIILGQQINELLQSTETNATTAQQAESMGSALYGEAETDVNNESYANAAQDMGMVQNQAEEGLRQNQQMLSQIQQMQLMYAKMPDTIPALEMELMVKDKNKKPIKVQALEVIRTKTKKIKRVLMANDTIVEKEYIPLELFPIINLVYSWGGSPNKTYGVIHFIKDIEQAMNKMYSMAIYDMQVNGQRKVIAFEDTIAEPTQVERNWAVPGAWITIQANPSLPDAGKPIVIEPSPLNQTISFLLQSCMQMIEYTTGMSGIMQGNPQDAPSTFGATQSLQAFGTQRVKLYSRALEQSLERLSLAIVGYLQAYAPRDKVVRYLDEDGDGQEVQLMSDTTDLKFKVRVDVTNSLPTTRQQAAQLLGMIAQTAGDPTLASLYTQLMLKISDIPEGKEWAEKIDIVQNMQQQLQQAQQTIQELSSAQKSMQNMMTQKEAAANIKLETERAKNQMNIEATKAGIAMNPMEDEEELELPTIDFNG